MGGPDKFLHLSPESRLLLQCARTHFLNCHAEQVAALVAMGIQWPEFLHLAKLHGVAPLVSRNLRTVGSGSIPSKYLEILQNYSQASGVMNQFLTTELVELVELFRNKKILVVPFKGPTLALSAYGALHFREFGDLDLFVRRDDIPAARRILESRGYQTKDETSKAETDEQLKMRIYHTFVKGNGMIHVDLQWNMSGDNYSFLLDQAIFLEDLHAIVVGGKTIPTFTPENLLIILCVHGTKHVWECLKWICDVAELMVSHPDLDWNVIVSRSSHLHVRRVVMMGVYLAHYYFQAPLPGLLKQELSTDLDIPSLAMGVPNDLLGRPQEGVQEQFSGGFYFLLKDSVWDRWRYGLQLCQNTNAIFVTRLPWFRLQTRLQMLFWITFPFQIVLRTMTRSLGLSGTASRLVTSWLK